MERLAGWVYMIKEWWRINHLTLEQVGEELRHGKHL